MSASLEERPNKYPTEASDLDRYEQLIEVTRLAGDGTRAFDLFWDGMGGYNHLGWVLGDYARIRRILAGFSTDGSPSTAGLALNDHVRAVLLGTWGLVTLVLGDLPGSSRAHHLNFELCQAAGDPKDITRGMQNVAEAELIAARWPAALLAGRKALAEADRADDDEERKDSHSFLGTALGRLGRLDEARKEFAESTKMESHPRLYSLRGVWEAELNIAAGTREEAHDQTEANRAVADRHHWTDDCARCDTLLGRCALPENPVKARRHITSAREYATRTGNIEVALRCYHLAAEIARHERAFPLAAAEALDGIQLADSCGFGRWSLDIRVELATIHLAAGDPRAAIEPASWVLHRAEQPDCQDAWAIADSLHLLGVAHARLGDTEKARSFLTRAVEKRTPLEHPGLAETRAELAALST
jgi:tetratricopeptide (TPR) repeat protein